MFKIIASDMDGTLLNPEHRIGSYTREILHTLHERGYIFAFATGRHHIDVSQHRELLGIPAYMITSNGAQVHDIDDNELLKQYIKPDVVNELVALMRGDDAIEIQMYTSTEWLINKESPSSLQFHKDSGFAYRLFDDKKPPVDDIAKVYFTSDNQDHEHLKELEIKINRELKGKVHTAFSTPWCLEVMEAGVHKGTGLEAVVKANGCTLDDCIAFGDGMNDVEMLTCVKKGLIMQTAHESVKMSAPELEIIGSCLDESVAHYLEDLLLK